MAKRKIIKIDEEKCNGCGLCIPNCPEGALRVIDGKARLVSDLFCDGLGACLGHCPRGAITTEEREAEPYDEKKVMGNIVKAGAATIKAHLVHLENHGETGYLNEAVEYLSSKNIAVPDYREEQPCAHFACPGSAILDRTKDADNSGGTTARADVSSQLRQWPVQLHLINPHAPYFKEADLLITADCVPFACGNFHQRFLKGRVVIIFCPKLDEGLEQYIEKLTAVLKDNDIKSITVLRMEVPCCGGTTSLLEEALKRSGKNITIREYVISLKGEIV
ncbi:MAG: 4Fe-4S binding protein [Elusimicrobia bacterium]|nr:4Fe-4S binding protein [Elusimicrobiota bacterium]